MILHEEDGENGSNEKEKEKVGQNSEEKLTTDFVFAFMLTFFLFFHHEKLQKQTKVAL